MVDTFALKDPDALERLFKLGKEEELTALEIGQGKIIGL